MHFESRIGQRAQGRPTSLPQQERGSGDRVQEHLLHGRGAGSRVSGHLADVVEAALEAGRQGLAARHHDRAAGDVVQAWPVYVDDAEPGLAQARIDAQDAHQWRKWRVPVNTTGMPRSSAAAITSSSRRLPPGWITQLAPASTTTSSPSRKGKKASEATAAPASVRPAFSALIEAIRAESTRLIWPAPTPRVMPLPANTMALDFTYLATFQAKCRSSIWASVGWVRVTTRNSASGIRKSSGVCTSQPPPTRLTSKALRPSPSGTCSTRTFFLPANTAMAWDEYSGASTTSTNCLLTASAVATSTGR